MNYFSTVLRKIINSFGERFQEFRANKATLAFIVRPLKIKINEFNLAPFDTDASLLTQLIYLKSYELSSNKFTDLTCLLEELEREKSNLISQHKYKTAMKQLPKIETIIFDTWNKLA